MVMIKKNNDKQIKTHKMNIIWVLLYFLWNEPIVMRYIFKRAKTELNPVFVELMGLQGYLVYYTNYLHITQDCKTITTSISTIFSLFFSFPFLNNWLQLLLFWHNCNIWSPLYMLSFVQWESNWILNVNV